MLPIDPRNLVVAAANDYFRKKFNLKPFTDYSLKNKEEYDSIAEIIALECSIYLLRRSYFLDENIEYLSNLRDQKIKAYEDKFKEIYMDYNKHVLW